jgi:hypothetical protein
MQLLLDDQQCGSQPESNEKCGIGEVKSEEAAHQEQEKQRLNGGAGCAFRFPYPQYAIAAPVSTAPVEGEHREQSIHQAYSRHSLHWYLDVPADVQL